MSARCSPPRNSNQDQSDTDDTDFVHIKVELLPWEKVAQNFGLFL
jgi:hypothetical protein